MLAFESFLCCQFIVTASIIDVWLLRIDMIFRAWAQICFELPALPFPLSMGGDNWRLNLTSASSLFTLFTLELSVLVNW